ncbi:hypothetical protein [Streptomyces sp. bgisy153]|uniref:hypothetical protein n=1 Tax=Streptomyces sp. bgisy153 TaxID=3413793 RepID=UPI003D71CFD4
MSHVWLRLADDRLARAADIRMADLWGPAADERTPPISGQPARIMIQRSADRDAWDEVALCDGEQGGLLVVSLLSTLAAAAAAPGDVRFVYGLYNQGRLLRWAYGATLPLADERVPPLHELRDPLPGRWLVPRASRS